MHPASAEAERITRMVGGKDVVLRPKKNGEPTTSGRGPNTPPRNRPGGFGPPTRGGLGVAYVTPDTAPTVAGMYLRSPWVKRTAPLN